MAYGLVFARAANVSELVADSAIAKKGNNPSADTRYFVQCIAAVTPFIDFRRLCPLALHGEFCKIRPQINNLLEPNTPLP